MIEDPRVSDDTPERARWETWAENLRGGDRFATAEGTLIADEVLEDGIVDREGDLHDWSDVWPPDDELPICPDCGGYGTGPDTACGPDHDNGPCRACNGTGLVGGTP